MKRHFARLFTLMAAVILFGAAVLESTAHARAGGSRSMGSRGSRSYSRPASPSYQPSQQRQQAGPTQSPGLPQQSGGFLRSMAGGLAGGMLGSMLFRGTGNAGSGAMGGGGMGLFEILLLAGIGYLIYRFIKKKRADSASNTYKQSAYQDSGALPMFNSGYGDNQPPSDGVNEGLSHIRQMDSSFDENRFNDTVMDVFFKIQGAWMNRDLAPVSGLLSDEMKKNFQEDLDKLLRDKQINRLENIAVRNVEIHEAWQESGQDYITALIYANLLDYTTDDTSGAVVSGSKTDPVKFEEFWTLTRPVGNNPWRLSAISQK